MLLWTSFAKTPWPAFEINWPVLLSLQDLGKWHWNPSFFQQALKMLHPLKSKSIQMMDTLQTASLKLTRKKTKREIPAGIYKNVFDLLNAVVQDTTLQRFEYIIDPATDKLTLKFAAREGISFEDEEIPSILGFKLPRDFIGYRHVGYKMDTQLYGQDNVPNEHTGIYPVDIACGSQLMFLYVDIIEHQYVGNVKAPILKIIDTERRLKNGSLTVTTPIQQKTFETPDFKPLLFHNIQNIKVELRTETGKLVPFLGVGKVIVNLLFKRVD